MPTLRLRAMRKADLSWVAQAERQLFSAEAWSPQLLASELDAMESLDDRFYVVAEVDATMAGYAGVWLGDSADVLTIATLPHFRRQGWGGLCLMLCSTPPLSVSVKRCCWRCGLLTTAPSPYTKGLGLKP